MKKEDVHAILEGCDHHTPSRIAYEPLDIQIPENASVLLIPRKLFLYGRFPDFEYSASRILRPNETARGYPLTDDWAFEMPRSITTRKGSLYLADTFYTIETYYFNFISTLLKDCNRFFNGCLSLDDLSKIQRRLG